jgi:hypothetical protein
MREQRGRKLIDFVKLIDFSFKSDFRFTAKLSKI